MLVESKVLNQISAKFRSQVDKSKIEREGFEVEMDGFWAYIIDTAKSRMVFKENHQGIHMWMYANKNATKEDLKYLLSVKDFKKVGVKGMLEFVNAFS